MPKKDRSKSKKGQSSKLHTRYENGKLKGKLCPKCRSFLAQHEDRVHCGKCGYAETTSKKAEAQ